MSASMSAPSDGEANQVQKCSLEGGNVDKCLKREKGAGGDAIVSRKGGNSS